jgi:hypothetical protein
MSEATRKWITLQRELAQMAQALHNEWVSEENIVAACYARVVIGKGERSLLQILLEHGRISHSQYAVLVETSQYSIAARVIGARPTGEELALANTLMEQGLLSREKIQHIVRIQSYLAQLQIDRSLNELLDICKLITPEELKRIATPSDEVAPPPKKDMTQANPRQAKTRETSSHMAQPTKAKMLTQSHAAISPKKATQVMPAINRAVEVVGQGTPARRKNKLTPLISADKRWPVVRWSLAIFVVVLLAVGLLIKVLPVYRSEQAAAPAVPRVEQPTAPLPPLASPELARKRRQARISGQQKIIEQERKQSEMLQWQGYWVGREQHAELVKRWGNNGRPPAVLASLQLDGVHYWVQDRLPYLAVAGSLAMPNLPKHMGVRLQVALCQALQPTEADAEGEISFTDTQRFEATLPALARPLTDNLYYLRCSLIPARQSEFVRYFLSLQHQEWLILLALGEATEIEKSIRQQSRHMAELLTMSQQLRQKMQSLLQHHDKLPMLAREWSQFTATWPQTTYNPYLMPMFPASERLLASFGQSCGELEIALYQANKKLPAAGQNLPAINRSLDVKYEELRVSMHREEQKLLRLLQETKAVQITRK